MNVSRSDGRGRGPVSGRGYLSPTDTQLLQPSDSESEHGNTLRCEQTGDTAVVIYQEEKQLVATLTGR